MEARVSFRREGDWIVASFDGVDAHGRPLLGEGRVLHQGVAHMDPAALAAAGFSFGDLNPVKLVKSAAHAVSSATRDVAHAASSAVKTVTKPLEKIPIISTALHVTLAVTPFGLAQQIASGARLDHALLNDFKQKISAATEVAPYASTIVSFVPGIGSGAAAAIAAGAALAEGKSITSAVEAAIKNAIPGGALIQAGFDVAIKAAQGQNVGEAALNAARAQLPPAAQKAFDIGLAVATAKSLQKALETAVTSLLPGQLQTIMQAGEDALKKTPALAAIVSTLKDTAQQSGVKLAAGLLAHKGMNEGTLAAVRSKLQGPALAGFDAAIKSQIPHAPWLARVPEAQVWRNIADAMHASPAQQAHAAAAAAAAKPKSPAPRSPVAPHLTAAAKPKPKPAVKPHLTAAPAPVRRPTLTAAAPRPPSAAAALVPAPRPPVDVRAKQAFEGANALLAAAEKDAAGQATLDGHLRDLASRATKNDEDGEKCRRVLKILGIVRDWRTALRAAQNQTTVEAATVHGMVGGLDLPTSPIPDPARLAAAGVPPGSY